MQEFYLDVELNRGLTRIQVDEVPPEACAMPGSPQFIIEYHTAAGFLTLTLQLESGTWSVDELYLLSPDEVKAIGSAISNHMIVSLTAYMGLFIPQFRNPTLN
jgi:hypothetical protein